MPKKDNRLLKIYKGLLNVFQISYTNSVADADCTYCLTDSHSAGVAEEALGQRLSGEDSRLSAFQNHDRVSQICDSVGKQSPTFQEQPDALLGTSRTTVKRNIMKM